MSVLAVRIHSTPPDTIRYLKSTVTNQVAERGWRIRESIIEIAPEPQNGVRLDVDRILGSPGESYIVKSTPGVALARTTRSELINRLGTKDVTQPW